MEKTRKFIASWGTIMKVSLVQLSIILLTAVYTYGGYEASAQELLMKQVSARFVDTDIKTALTELELKANVKFVYTSRLVPLKRKVTLNIVNKSIAETLDALFSPDKVTCKIVRNRILLSVEEHMESSVFGIPDPEDMPVITDRTIKGKITDEKGEGLPGVSVILKGTQRGTISATDGGYELVVPEGGNTLIFSFVGYVTEEIETGSRSVINVNLRVDEKSLEELVVVGYGEQSRKKISTSISKVSGKDINNLPVALPGDALAGLAAGVQVQAGAGDVPGAAPTIRIRGIGSLGASNQPLYVIDGYPLNATEFSRINLSDIESIEILKDAASAAIYGSRAANGVIMVTTKRGQKGKMNFNFNAYSGVQSVARRIEVMNQEEYLQYAKDARGASGVPYPDAYDYPEQLASTDWQDEIFRIAPMSKFELGARGGNENIRFALSGSYLQQKGTMLGTDYKLMTVRANLDANITKSLSIGANFAPSYTILNEKPTPRAPGNWGYSPIYAAMLFPPVVDVRLPNGDYGQNNVLPHTQYGFSEVAIYNPVSILSLYKDQSNRFSIQNNLFLEWQIVQGLKFRSQGGALLLSGSRETYLPSTLASSVAPFANISTPQLSGIASSASNNRGVDWIWENNLTYSNHFGGSHNLTAMALYSMQKATSFSTGTSGRVGSFTNDLVHNPSASSDQIGSVSYGIHSFLSYALRINYDFKDRYLFSGAVRRDGSSRFGPNNRFGIFQSYSVGWRISEEGFMQDQRLFSDLKLRASYGETGNANIGDFTWISGMVPSHYSFGGQRLPGATPSGFLNRDLTWEKSRQVNLGLDASFLKDRLSLTLDVYQKNTDGMLFSKELPAIIGYATSFQTNIGEIRNRGVEIDLSTNNQIGRLKWTTSFNLSYNATKVLDLGGRESLNSQVGTPGWNNVYQIHVGEPLGNFYGFIIDGVIKNETQLADKPQWTGSKVGDYQIRDVNNDGVINEDDRTILGNGFPRILYGLTNNLSYSNFDLSFIIQGVARNSIVNGASRHTELWSGRFNAVKEMANNYFDPANPEKEVKYARVGPRSGFGTASNLHSYAVYSGSFLRFRNVTLGYTLPPSLQQKLSLNATRIYLTGQNLFTFTKYPGFNPEPSQYGDTVYQPGSDQATYPVNRSVMIGVNISF